MLSKRPAIGVPIHSVKARWRNSMKPLAKYVRIYRRHFMYCTSAITEKPTTKLSKSNRLSNLLKRVRFHQKFVIGLRLQMSQSIITLNLPNVIQEQADGWSKGPSLLTGWIRRISFFGSVDLQDAENQFCAPRPSNIVCAEKDRMQERLLHFSILPSEMTPNVMSWLCWKPWFYNYPISFPEIQRIWFDCTNLIGLWFFHPWFWKHISNDWFRNSIMSIFCLMR